MNIHIHKHPDHFQIESVFFHHRVIKDIQQLFLHEAECSLLWLSRRDIGVWDVFDIPLVGHLIIDTFMSVSWEIFFLPKDRRHHNPGLSFSIDIRNWWKWRIGSAINGETFAEHHAFLGNKEKEEEELNFFMNQISNSFSLSPSKKK
jgi:hypothetical protein